MCGIAGFVPFGRTKTDKITRILSVMNAVQKHRGPDDAGIWVAKNASVGLSHVRLSIIDLFQGHQPMEIEPGLVITYNGEIYNYIELREQLGRENFKTNSDTEVILRAYEKWGEECVNYLRGMFAFAIWDEKNNKLFCARDRFGIKPFYYTQTKEGFFFASEVKALLAFVEEIATDYNGLSDYFAFQFTLDGKTLFKDIERLIPAHTLVLKNKGVSTRRYWEVHYRLDWTLTESYFKDKIGELLDDSIRLHLRSDVPVGSYVSGGLDSSIVTAMARKIQTSENFQSFTGKFKEGPEYDESRYARALAKFSNLDLHELEITSNDFIENMRKVIYHLDYPVAGPGAFPQYMVSKLASQHLKVVLGGQGGDEIFGGYARYLMAYFEQCIKGAIEGTMHSGNFVVTYESIIPNLATLRNYVPMLKEFWSEGLFENRDARYFKLINRASDMKDMIDWKLLGSYNPFESFKNIFWKDNVQQESYFDSMTHFDFKTSLPAMLQVEDRMGMAHGLESRVPFLDHPLVELAATIPANIKFKNGTLKYILRAAFNNYIPSVISQRQDKMGFPVPLTEWLRTDLKGFIQDIFSSHNARTRPYLSPEFDIQNLILHEGKFSRRVWALLCLELWQQEFHDQAQAIKNSDTLMKGELDDIQRRIA